jgi:RND family efflux transporter MFP subunit
VPGGEAFAGTVESPDRAVLAARIDARVRSIAVREGEAVRAGQLLLHLGENTAGARLSEAEGRHREAAARLELAEREHARTSRLFAGEAATRQELDRSSAAREGALQAARAAEAAVEAARVAAGYARVVAPFDGRVVRREVEVGSTVLPGTPLLVLDRSGAWRVRVEIPESAVGRLAPGMPLAVEIPALGRTLSGRVAEILPAADPRSRSFSVKIGLGESEGLAAGLYARIAAPGGERPALLVPATALVERGQLTGVYVVTDGVLRYRLVHTGRRLGGQVEILSGLREGERIVADETRRAVDGARLEE